MTCLLFAIYNKPFLDILKMNRSGHLRCSVKKGVLNNFANFTGVHLCCSLFLIKLQDFAEFLKTPIL